MSEKKPTGRTPLSQALADVEGGDDWGLFLNTEHGLPVWRAYLRYRERGLPVREEVLRQFDRWAAALEAAYRRALREELTAKAEHLLILQALNLAGTKKKPRGFKRLAQHERRRALAARIAFLRGPGKRTWEQVAHEVQLGIGQAKECFYEFNPGPAEQKRRAREAAAASTFAALSRRK